MYQYLLFDLDGTLTDPEEGITKSIVYALRKFGIEVEDRKTLYPFIGPPLEDSFSRFYDMDSSTAKQAVAYYRERFSTVGKYENKVYPGIPSLLDALQKQGCKLAVASSKPEVFVRDILHHFKLDTYFAVIVGSELSGERTEKEEVLKEALRQLLEIPTLENKDDIPQELRESCVMVGDRHFDIRGAKQYGIASIGVTYGYAQEGELQEAGADYIASRVYDVKNILLEDSNSEPRVGGLFAGNPIATPVSLIMHMVIPTMLYFILMQVLGSFGMGLFGDDMRAKMLAYVGSGICVILFYLWNKKTTRSLPGDMTRKHYVMYLTGAILLSVSLNLLAEYFQMINWVASSQETTGQSAMIFWQGIVLYVILSPICEEYLFRGILLTQIMRVMNPWIAVLFSSLVFAFAHGNFLQMIYAFVMGLLLSQAYRQSERLWIPISLHAAANLVIWVIPYLL